MVLRRKLERVDKVWDERPLCSEVL